MFQLPDTIQNLIHEFNKLPGIGHKTSEKFVYFLLNQPQEEIDKFTRALDDLKKEITICEKCFNFSSQSPCDICGSSSRDKGIVCIVSESADLQALEKTNEFKGIYHVLGGTINQIEGVGPENLKITELIERVKNDGISEIILALDPDMAGETTSLYLVKQLRPLEIKITRLARGLPSGADLEYADEMTLTDALKERREII
ncbi:MAG: recombination mediator RecR [Patescibacteria group bacterium]